MGRNRQLKAAVWTVRMLGTGDGTEQVEGLWQLIQSLRPRTRNRLLSRATGMETKYTETSLSKKKEPGMSRGFHRALNRAWKNSPEAVERVQKTYPGVRVSSGLTRTCVYE